MPRPEFLSRKPHRHPFGEERAERQRLAGRPVEPLAGLDHLAARIEQAGQLAVDVKTGRIAVEGAADFAQQLVGDPRLVVAQLLLADQRLQAGPPPLQPVRLVRFVLRRRLERLLQLLAHLGRHAIHLPGGQHPLADQLLGVDLSRRRLPGDGPVHDRLGERGLVRLVVPEPSIAEHVDDDIALELLAEFGGDAGDVHRRFRIVAIDMEDRRLNHLGDVRGVRRGPGVGRAGGETDLVVDDEMNGAADPVALQLGEPETLRGEPLAGDRRVAVKQDPHHLIALSISALRLFRPDLAEDDRIDGFQVRRVGGQRKVDLVAVEAAVGRRAEVVLDVPRALHLIRMSGVPLKLGEDRDVGLDHDVGQHVEPAAVGHAQDDFHDAELARPLQDLLECRDGRLAPVQPETLRAGEFDMQKALEFLRFDQPLEDGALAPGGELRLVADALDPLLDPRLLFRVLDVHELDADRPTVGFAQDLRDLTQRRGLQAEHVVEKDRPVHVGFGKAVGLRIQFRVILLALEAERIEAGHQVAANAINANQHQRPHRVDDRRARIDERAALRAGRPRPRRDGDRCRAAVVRRRYPRPARAARFAKDDPRVLAQLRKKRSPARIDRAGVFREAAIQIGDIGRVCSGKEGFRRDSH